MSASSYYVTSSPDFSIESELYLKGYRYIAGIDEAGRGSLAGPLSLGMVIYDAALYNKIPDDISNSVNDSKKLSHKKRLAALDLIYNYSYAACHTFVPHSVIDRVNINGATYAGILKLLEKTSVKPDIVIMDGNFKFQLPTPSLPVVRGDSRSLSISSASIIAKVIRDNIMDRIDQKYPCYGFCRHKGYGTKDHIAAIKLNGVSPVHRETYEPAKGLLLAEVEKRL